MSYSFNVSLLILLKTNSKIAFLDVFLTVLHLIFFKEIFFYIQSHLFNRKKHKELEDLFASDFFHHVVSTLHFKMPYCSVS